jgi:hypothetical protein
VQGNEDASVMMVRSESQRLLPFIFQDLNQGSVV